MFAPKFTSYTLLVTPCKVLFAVAVFCARALDTNEIKVSIVFGNARVVPFTAMSEPSLKLQAALLSFSLL